jgi:CRP/FNR family cyclic AMP-dependent transcriptional regulator
VKRTNQVSSLKLLQLMAKIPFFEKITVFERSLMSEFAQIYIASAGEAIIEKNAIDNCFYILLSGKGLVCVRRDAEPLATISPGEFFGEVGFILNNPRTSWVFAESVSALLRIDKELLNRLDGSTRDKVKDQVIIKLAKTVTNFNSKS